jgi:CRP-like cAMP-binding protein
MGNIREVLNKSAVFEKLSDEDVLTLEPLFEEREISPGDVLASHKDAAQYFFLLAKGTLLLAMPDGRSVILNTQGDFIGFELLSAKGIYKATLTALEKGSVFAVLRQNFLAVIREDTQAAETIMACWQEYLETAASFARKMDELDLPEIL